MSRTLGPYEILAPLGAGGMGEVFRARDLRLGREVAIKLLPPDFASDSERVARFAREARLLASLRHPGIATIHSFEDVDGRKLLVMELVEGEGLDARIARGPIPAEEALPIARQIAEALEEAHERGIIHRDLKPGNVKLTADGRVKLLDFGLAKLLTAPDSAGPEDDSASLSPTISHSPSVTGMIIGTASYLAPEQARGRPVDRRADIWAFGVLVFEMLTGRRLFQGATVSDIIAGVLRQDIDFDTLPPETPASVRELLRRCLERDPKKRLRDIGEARIALERASETAPLAIAPQTAPLTPVITRPKRRVRFLQVSAFVLAATAIGLLAAWLISLRTPPPAVRMFRMPAEDLDLDVVFSPVFSRPLLSPDGTRLAYSAAGRLRILELDGVGVHDVVPSGATNLSSPEGLTIFWAPDSSAVAFAYGRRLWRVSRDGGAPSVICDLPETADISGGTWASNGTIVFGAWRGSLYSVLGSGGIPKIFLARDPKREIDFHNPQFLPDGKTVMFIPHLRGAGLKQVDILTAGGKRRAIFKEDDFLPTRAEYNAAAQSLILERQASEGIWSVPFSLRNLRVTGERSLVITDGTMGSSTRDGTLSYVTGAFARPLSLAWVDHAGQVSEPLGQPMRAMTCPTLSPDETRIAISGLQNGLRDIWVQDISRGTRERATPEHASDIGYDWPAWSPSGEYILFTRMIFKLMKGEIATTASDGGGDVRTLATGGRASISPDGQHLIYAIDEGGGQGRLVWLPIDRHMTTTGPPQSLPGSRVIEGDNRVAPSGDLIAYESNETDRVEISLKEFPSGSGRLQVSTEGGAFPRWSKSGDKLYYIAGDDMMEVDVHRKPSLSLSAPRRLFSLRERKLIGVRGYDVAADGRLLMLRETGGEDAPHIVVVINGAQLLRSNSAR